jgi:putative endonuclease
MKAANSGKVQKIGGQGERVALAFLRSKGYVILERNYRTRRGEIDIVARQGRTVVFVEVKTARGYSYGPPRCWVGWRKRSRLIRTASAYLARKGLGDADCRFDVIAIELSLGSPRLTHIVNAFSA